MSYNSFYTKILRFYKVLVTDDKKCTILRTYCQNNNKNRYCPLSANVAWRYV